MPPQFQLSGHLTTVHMWAGRTQVIRAVRMGPAPLAETINHHLHPIKLFPLHARVKNSWAKHFFFVLWIIFVICKWPLYVKQFIFSTDPVEDCRDIGCCNYSGRQGDNLDFNTGQSLTPISLKWMFSTVWMNLWHKWGQKFMIIVKFFYQLMMSW